MTNVEKLEQVGILDDVRQRLGAKDGNDTTYDDKINKMSNIQLIAKHCGWILGDEAWWKEMKHMYDELELLDKESND